MDNVSSLTLDVRPGEVLSIGVPPIEVRLIHKSGQLARLRVTAGKDIAIEKKQDMATDLRAMRGKV